MKIGVTHDFLSTFKKMSPSRLSIENDMQTMLIWVRYGKIQHSFKE